MAIAAGTVLATYVLFGMFPGKEHFPALASFVDKDMSFFCGLLIFFTSWKALLLGGRSLQNTCNTGYLGYLQGRKEALAQGSAK